MGGKGAVRQRAGCAAGAGPQRVSYLRFFVC